MQPTWAAAGGTREQLDALIENTAWPWAAEARPNGEDPGGNGPDARAPQKPAFPLIPWKEIAFDLEEEWRVERVLPLVGIGCLCGGPGSVKTFVLLDLFACMARGGFWGGREVKQCSAVYIAAEGGNGIKKRIAGLKKVAAEKGLPADIPFHLVTVAPNLGTGDGDCKKLIADIEATGAKPGAIAIDTTTQALGGADENGAGMDALVVNATAIAAKFQCLVVLVHHTPVADDDRLRGKGSLLGGLDVSIISKREKGSFVGTLTSQLHSWARLLGGEVSGVQVLCPGPGHGPQDRSLSVKMAATNGGFIVHSFSADDPLVCKDHVRKLLGMEPFKQNGHSEPPRKRTKCHFDYRGPDGGLLYQVEREDLPDGGKKIRQRRPDGNGGWVWNLGGVQPVPYRLPELLEALAHGRTIAIVEGEAKADLLWSWNIPATCNSGGAGKWRARYSAYLRGADAVVMPDNDPPGKFSHREINPRPHRRRTRARQGAGQARSDPAARSWRGDACGVWAPATIQC